MRLGEKVFLVQANRVGYGCAFVGGCAFTTLEGCGPMRRVSDVGIACVAVWCASGMSGGGSGCWAGL